MNIKKKFEKKVKLKIYNWLYEFFNCCSLLAHYVLCIKEYLKHKELLYLKMSVQSESSMISIASFDSFNYENLLLFFFFFFFFFTLFL